MTNQQLAILNYLKLRHTITAMEAVNDLGITKLATRIGELKRQGYPIDRIYITEPNRYGTKSTYAKYFLKYPLNKEN